MKKVIVIFFIFSFLGANTALGEIFKLPLLIHHYIEHNQEDDDNSIIGFLAEHYGEDINHHHHDNHNDHDHLPFKTINSSVGQTAYILPLFIESTKLVHRKKLKTPVFQEQNYSNAYLDSIWQPPKYS